MTLKEEFGLKQPGFGLRGDFKMLIPWEGGGAKENSEMPLNDTQIHYAVRDRLCERWPKRMIEEGAAPIAAVGVIQKPGERFGLPVLCSCEGISDEALGEFLIGVGESLITQAKAEKS